MMMPTNGSQPFGFARQDSRIVANPERSKRIMLHNGSNKYLNHCEGHLQRVWIQKKTYSYP